MREIKSSELDIWFPKESIPIPSGKKLEKMRSKLHSSAQWQRFTHLSQSAKGMRLNLSTLTEKVIPWIHYIFEDDDFDFKDLTSPKDEKQSHKSAVIGNALHEAVSLFDLYRYSKKTKEEITNSFPSHNEDLIIPFIKALAKNSNSIAQIWESFHTDELLVDRSKYLLSQEFENLPLSQGLVDELKIRRSEETYNLGLKLANNFQKNADPRLKHYSETLGIFNFTQISPIGESRLQIPVRFDEIITEAITKNNIAYHFFDLKTGKQINDWPHHFQSLLMEFLAGHFVDQFFRKDILPNIGKPFISPPIKNILPYPKELSFQFGYFDKDSGSIKRIPIIQNYQSREGELFLGWLAFYSDASCAFKEDLKNYLKFAKPFDKKNKTSYQLELKEFPIYQVGFSRTSEKCDQGGCGQFLNQICTPRIRGETKTLIWVSMECPVHGPRSFDKKFVRNEEIYYPQSSQDNGKKTHKQ